MLNYILKPRMLCWGGGWNIGGAISEPLTAITISATNVYATNAYYVDTTTVTGADLAVTNITATRIDTTTLTSTTIAAPTITSSLELCASRFDSTTITAGTIYASTELCAVRFDSTTVTAGTISAPTINCATELSASRLDSTTITAGTIYATTELCASRFDTTTVTAGTIYASTAICAVRFDSTTVTATTISAPTIVSSLELSASRVDTTTLTAGTIYSSTELCAVRLDTTTITATSINTTNLTAGGILMAGINGLVRSINTTGLALATSANIDQILPPQTGLDDYVLTTNATSAYWAVGAGTGAHSEPLTATRMDTTTLTAGTIYATTELSSGRHDTTTVTATSVSTTNLTGTNFTWHGGATSGKILKSDGTNWVASTETFPSPGTSGDLLKSDGTNWISSSSFSISELDLTAAASSTPWPTGTATAPVASGQTYYNTTSKDLTIGDGTTAQRVVTQQITTVYEVEAIPCGWFQGAVTPPVTATALTSVAGCGTYRDFTAGDDVVFEWMVPYGIDTSVGPTFQVEGYITCATAPTAGQCLQFSLSGTCLVDSMPLSTAQGAGFLVTKTFADANYLQKDKWLTGYSGAVTIANLVTGGTVIFHLSRTTCSDFAGDCGVGWIKLKYARKLQGS